MTQNKSARKKKTLDRGSMRENFNFHMQSKACTGTARAVRRRGIAELLHKATVRSFHFPGAAGVVEGMYVPCGCGT